MSSSSLVDQEPAQNFLPFVNASVSPFHAVAESAKRLSVAGFQRISEAEPWKLKASGNYYFTRNSSTLVAFSIGSQYVAGNGLNMIGAHTDSPVLRLKPKTNKVGSGYLQVGVQTYGGGLWRTWFDRDLSVAGRLMYRTSDGRLQQHLVKIDHPILRIPSLAIHLRPPEEINNETHLAPILATLVRDQLSEEAAHHGSFMEALAAALTASSPSPEPFSVANIMDFELSLYDTQPAAIGGLKQEFIFSPRLDNLMSSYCALQALIQTATAESLAQETNIRVCLLFDNEEVGSCSYQGAASSLIEHLFSRVTSSFTGPDTSCDALETAYCKSFAISADMAHAVHPNFSDKHETKHQPQIHRGPVIKQNCNLRYATSATSGALLRLIAMKHAIPVQEFVVRQDGPCGSTIGPMVSAKGVRVVDVGNPQLAMHSIREMCGTDDVAHALNLFSAFYNEFSAIDRTLDKE